MGELDKAAAAADAVTSKSLADLMAMLTIYSDEEKAAFIEGVIVGSFTAGQMAARAESAGMNLAPK